MNSDFGDLVFNLVHHIIKLQKNINFNNPVMKGIQLIYFVGYVVYQFPVSIEMKRLNVYVHRMVNLNCETINKELIWLIFSYEINLSGFVFQEKKTEKKS